MTLHNDGMSCLDFKVYRKPGSAYAYLPYGSYHARHNFRGWLKAEMHRLLTHSSKPSVWLKEITFFYNHLRDRGYPARAPCRPLLLLLLLLLVKVYIEVIQQEPSTLHSAL
jgi:hypothetical protein